MNILEELKRVISPLNIPLETGVFSEPAPNEYIVLVPLTDSFPLNADNNPLFDAEEVRISVFSKGNYITLVKKIVKTILRNEFYVTDRRYNGFETDVGYHQYTIDIAKLYDIDMEEN